ncbi:uncharacterized mitochondrial protein AtMg00810-like [Rutidosis leptorrhynchoides]|uniref:uncharacterized mitochondrial protein AtMg00810-like n=1 Tax=Rutidosis leptorrhynchoides TaxID=125765 RepID=UPI003A99B67C
MFLFQQKYAEEILERAGMSTCHPSATPVDTNSNLSNSSGTLYSDPTLYRSLAGALQYLTITRPDLSYSVQQICLHMHAPMDIHMLALKRILRYIRSTLTKGLQLYKGDLTQLVSYTDADWGGCPDTRHSTSGYCVFFGDNLLSWSSKRQSTLSRSCAEAEYREVSNVVSEVCWLSNLLLELHCPIRKATLVFCDNVSAIYLAGYPVARGIIRVLHIPSRYQTADIFMKGLPHILFDDFRDSLNVREMIQINEIKQRNVTGGGSAAGSDGGDGAAGSDGGDGVFVARR